MRTNLIPFLIAHSWLAAQAPAAHVAPAFSVRGAMLTLSVPNLDASAKWYTDKLGLRLVHAYPTHPAVHAKAVLLQGGGLALELVQEEDAVDRGPPPQRGLAKAGLVVSDFERVVSTLRARGVEFASVYPRRPDQPANVTFRDNAGNLIALYEGFSLFNDPLIGLAQADSAILDRTSTCFEGQVLAPPLSLADTMEATRGLSGVRVTLS